MTFGCATTPARPGNGVIATLRNERGAAWRVKDTRRPPFWAARPARCRPAHWHPRGGGHADGYLSPPAGTAPAPMTCGKLHILCAPPAAPDTRTRTGRAGEGKGAPDGGRAGGDAGDARGRGPDDPGPSATPEDAGDARGAARGHPHDGSARRRGRGRESGQRQERQVLLVAGGPAGADAAEKTGRPAGADGPEAASANEKARNRWVSAGSGPALVVRGGGLEPP